MSVVRGIFGKRKTEGLNWGGSWRGSWVGATAFPMAIFRILSNVLEDNARHGHRDDAGPLWSWPCTASYVVV